MQFIIQRVDAALESAGIDVNYVALIDRRWVREQRGNPWVVGELVYVV
jgi:hypothetical protein